MNLENIIKKVEEYLLNTGTEYVADSIEYLGIRENFELIRGDKKNYYFVSYDVLIDKNNKYSTTSFFAYIEVETEKLSYIIGPQSSQKID